MAYRSGFVSHYLDPLQLEAEVAQIVHDFPALCTLEPLPYRSHGYSGSKVEARGQHPMHVLRITATGTAGTLPAVLLMRSHHAREWINALAIIETARQLVENYRPDDPDPSVQQVVKMLQSVEFLIIPESNPDGARLSFFDAGYQFWRKNLRPPVDGNCAGVDCNRNFPAYFGEAGSSGVRCSETYRGPYALSEPETANVAHLVAQDRTILFAVDSHSYGQAIFRPTSTGGTYVSTLPITPQDEAIYRHLEDAMNQGIARVQGIRYSTGTTSNHAGTTDEYLFFRHGIYAFDLECGTDFQPPPANAVAAALEVAEAVRALGWCATGETGLDIQAMLKRRAAADAAPPITTPLVTGPRVAQSPWPIDPLPPHQWRRFRARCTFAGALDMAAEARKLLDLGFDVLDKPERSGAKLEDGTLDGAQPREMELIVSADDIAELLRLGYTLVVDADLMGMREADGQHLSEARLSPAAQ